MTAKSLREAVLKALESDNGPFEDRMKGELNDFLAHQILKFLGPRPTDPMTFIGWERNYTLLSNFIIYIRKD